MLSGTYGITYIHY